MADARRYAILAPGLFASRSAKTAHGAIAYAAHAEIVAVIDPDHAGKRVRDVVPYLAHDAPVVATLDEALARGADTLLVGTAPAGGALPAAWRTSIARALAAGLDVHSGLHHFLADDPEFAAAAERGRSRVWDVRATPPPRLFTGDGYDVAARVVLTVGSDCAVGKMTASLELVRAAHDRGERARFVATGQTGIVIAGAGTAIDRVISDFATGAAEELVLANAPHADVLFVEGQGGINNPAFAPVTLALLFGSAPDALVLVHLATRTHVEDLGTPLLPLPRLVEVYESLVATVKPAKVAGIALNTHGLSAGEAAQAIARARDETGLPCDDLVRNGPHALYAAMAPSFAHKARPLR